MTLLSKVPKEKDPERPKKPVGSRFEAHRLEGRVKNRGIKNVGYQKKKESRPEYS